MHLKSGTFLQGGKYRIEKVLSRDSCSFAYLAAAFPRYGNDTALKVVLFEMYPNRYIGGRVGKEGVSYKVDSSYSDYGTMRDEYEEKLAMLSSDSRTFKLEDYFVHEAGDSGFPFMSFRYPLPDNVFDGENSGGDEETECESLCQTLKSET